MADATEFAVTIDGVTYTILDIPAKESGIVQARRSALEQDLRFDTLADGVARSRKLVWCAYNGVASAHELRTNVVRLQNHLTQAYARSKSTMNLVASECAEILDKMRIACQAVFRHDEAFAIQFLELCQDFADGLGREAQALADSFDEVAKTAVDELSSAKMREGMSEAQQGQIQDAICDLQNQMRTANGSAAQLRENRAVLAQQYREALEGEERANKRDRVTRCVRAVTAPIRLLTGTPPPGVSTAKSWHEVVALIKGLLLQNEQQQQEYLKQIGEHASRLAAARNDAAAAEARTHSLHLAAGGLAHVSTTLRNASEFWGCLRFTCESARAAATAERIQWYQALQPEARYDIYRADSFKVPIVQGYASWAAIGLMASEYSGVMKIAFDGLQMDLRSNPTLEESLVAVRTIAHDLENQTRQDLDASRNRLVTLATERDNASALAAR